MKMPLASTCFLVMDEEINYLLMCKRTSSPLDFVYNTEKGEYDLTPYSSDEKLLERIQSGHGENSSSLIYLESFLGGVEPSNYS